jgi:hypothetical protein
MSLDFYLEMDLDTGSGELFLGTINDYPKERAQQFLNKFSEICSAQDDDNYVIATIIRLIVFSPDLVDLTEYDLLDLADSISKL